MKPVHQAYQRSRPAQVRVTMLERTYSREFACPLVPKPAKAPSLHGEPILPDGAALA